MPNASIKNLSLLKVIELHLIPWTRQAVTSHIAIMPSQERDLPFGAHVESCDLSGPRVPIKHLRTAGHLSINTAQWPSANLSEKNNPFLLCVISGCANIQLGSQRLTCDAGNFVFIPPGLPHPDGTRPFTADGTACSILWTRRCGRGLRCWISHADSRTNFLPHRGESLYFYQEQVIHTFDALCDELLAHRKDETCHHALMLFLFLMRREIITKRVFDVSAASGTKMGYEEHSPLRSDPLHITEDYIQAHLADHLTIETVAQQVYMSRANFAKLFHQHTGQTFLEYVHHHRLQQACTFLHETTWTVGTIAELCGFVSVSGFSRFFVKQQGVTPLTYRNEHLLQ